MAERRIAPRSPLDLHFTLVPTCSFNSGKAAYKSYFFLELTVAEFEHCLDSIITNSIKTLEMGGSFDELNTISSSVSAGCLHLASFLIIHKL